ncbi:MAG: gliding motility-associated C-terminal domain-containing protein [Bacteroidia bacterium]|nr:gliding motility-associated C-terminal domain-containing protein [Bacteroidia bacterium]
MKAARKILLFILCTTAFNLLHATHNRAGEITYTRIAPTTTVVGGVTVELYKYRITLVKYTDYGSGVADRCVDTIYFGDGTRGIAPRTNGNTYTCGCNVGNTSIPCGSIIINASGYVVNKSIYIIEHVYPGPGDYLIRSYDPNRNENVVNIPYSVSQPFYVESLLIINSFTGANTSPIFNNAPIDKACVGQCFQHNPAAYDVDGDSLSYEISTSRGQGGTTVQGYTYPGERPKEYNIDAITGNLSWCSPRREGEYNLAFIVKEWRKNTNRVYQLIGYVLRDMQVIVGVCRNEDPPYIIVPKDTCVEAGILIEKNIYVYDPNDGDVVTLQGAGGAFSSNLPNATLNPLSAVTQTNPLTGLVSNFRWQTDCNHIRVQPYITIFKAQDNGSIAQQVSFASYAIKVIPPAVKNVTAVPQGTNMRVSWTLSSCNPANNPIVSYRIFRKNNCTPFTPDPCTGIIPASSGFVLIGQTNNNVSFFIDNNNGNGLVVGQRYSYLVVAFYKDGTQTYGTTQVCGELKRDVPVILNVDVLSTSTSTGSIRVKWEHPITNSENLDTLVFTGPYKYNLKRKNAAGGMDIIFSATANRVQNLPIQFIDNNLNTQTTPHEYVVEFTSGTSTVGTSQRASSVFLIITPSDRRMDLKWSFNTPWTNTTYTVSRKNPGSATYTAIATTTVPNYTDVNNIANRNDYCYFVTSEGAYSDPGITSPLINNSQQSCTTAVDLTPPCSPTLNISADCPAGDVVITWQDVRTLCDRSDDVTKYFLFYRPSINHEYKLLDTLLSTDKLEYVAKGLSEIVGCYIVQAVDSANNKSNKGGDYCIDNCPIFELPNVFTPNNDNINDFYMAVRVRQIKEINLNIFDRWGNLVYTTTDPYFKWDGISIISKQTVSQGTFFYTCDVFEPRLRGTIKRTLKGFVEVVR